MDALAIEELQVYLDRSPFIHFLALTVERVDAQAYELVLRMPMRRELERLLGTGQFHGGPIASLIDIAGDFAVALSVRGPVPTINFRVDYLRPATGSYLRGIGRARRIGRTICVADVEVLDEEGRLCAVGRGSYSSAPA